ncbi:unnamed protein product, partial [Rotaria sp. Silwood2]
MFDTEMRTTATCGAWTLTTTE